MFRTRFIPFLALTSAALAQQVATPQVASVGKPAQTARDPVFAPSWETQKQAGTTVLAIPAPRGQIVDRTGNPLAQTRISYNLCLQFPSPLSFSDGEVRAFVDRKLAGAGALLGRPISYAQDQMLKHYRNRGVLPVVVAVDLKHSEIEAIKNANDPGLVLQPTYQRHYPNGRFAGHILGYAGRSGRALDGPIQPNEPMWPGAEGREGLEQSFDDQLQGRQGQYHVSFDASGKRAAEQVAIPPQPGYNVVTTLDTRIQKLCEQALEKGCKRGALVFVDPNNGDILAMASWPSFNPNSFVPFISAEAFKSLQDDPNIPLLPRAFRSAYPPGSIFKVIVGVAALQSGKVDPHDEFSCPGSMKIGGLTFRNWKSSHAGSLDFADALTQSCDTWFYQVGIKIGGHTMADYSQRFGLGQRTGIPLNAEAGGIIPTDDYMLKVHNRKLLNGDLANFSIGQGDVTVTPLQMAMAMGAVGNGGTLYAARLVNQVQSIDGQIVTAYDVRARNQTDLDKEVFAAVKSGMRGVVESRAGTAPVARISGLSVAGKTGTAQWGPKNKERTAAWFAGFAPVDKPKYAFAVVYESDVRNADEAHGGTSAAPIAARVLRELAKDEKPPEKKKGKKKTDEDEEDEDAPPVRKAQAVKEERAD
jgi:penicillin-binding protein 2